MNDHEVSGSDVEGLTRTWAEALRGVKSLEDFERWLTAQSNVLSVTTADHLIKTWPPQKEVLVTFRTQDGGQVTKVIDVVEHPDRTFSLAGVHEP